MRKEPCETNEIYHIYNRGVDKRVVFSDNDEYRYFLHLLYALNTDSNTNNTRRTFTRNTQDHPDTDTEGGLASFRVGTHLVSVLAYVLMPNHFHLLLKQVQDDGIARYMQRLGTGHTMYFNKKHERSGSLFQGTYKNVHISSDTQLQHIVHYIHMNPLPLLTTHQQNTDAVQPIDFLSQYKWSSCTNYLGNRHFSSILSLKEISSYFDIPTGYRPSLITAIQNRDPLVHLHESEMIDSSEPHSFLTP